LKSRLTNSSNMKLCFCILLIISSIYKSFMFLLS
jgi:hypothetical protein